MFSLFFKKKRQISDENHQASVTVGKDAIKSVIVAGEKNITNVNITNITQLPKPEEKSNFKQDGLEPFKEKIYGIIVALFKGDTDEHKTKGKQIQSTIRNTVNARFSELNINDAEARQTSILIETHEQARYFGKEYNAQLVIWGEVTLQGIIPNITVVNQEDTISEVFKPETTILKDSLCHAAMAEIKDIRFPALTDELTRLVSFVTAMRYYDQKNYEKAIEYFTYSLPKQADNYIDICVILFHRGKTYAYMKQYDFAIDDYTQAIDLNPKKDMLYYNRGIIYRDKGEYNKAINDYSQAILLNPKNHYAYYNRGVTYRNKFEYDKAIDDFSQAISLNHRDDAAYNNRGLSYNDKGEYDKAIADYNQAISSNPKLDLAYNNRGVAYSNKSEYDKAIADYNQAIFLNQRFDLAYKNRGNTYYLKGEYDKAIADYNQTILLNPKDSVAYNNMKLLLESRPDDKYRDGNKAIEFAQKALESEPNNPAILDTLATAYAEAGKFEEAVATQKKAIKMLNEKDKDAITRYTERLNFYKARKPWREKSDKIQ